MFDVRRSNPGSDCRRRRPHRRRRRGSVDGFRRKAGDAGSLQEADAEHGDRVAVGECRRAADGDRPVAEHPAPALFRHSRGRRPLDVFAAGEGRHCHQPRTIDDPARQAADDDERRSSVTVVSRRESTSAAHPQQTLNAGCTSAPETETSLNETRCQAISVTGTKGYILDLSCTLYLLTTVTLGGACSGGEASPVSI